MPIHRVKLPSGQMGYKWGAHGHAYPSREDAENQEQAAYANGYAGDSLVTAAGIALKTSDGKYLFVKDASRETWCFPGGKSEPGEDAQTAALRELLEETNIDHEGELTPMGRNVMDGVDYTTFTSSVDSEITPELDGENTDYVWADADNLPDPLHPGVRDMFAKAPAMDMAFDYAIRGTSPKGEKLALDRASSVRSKDRDGRLHVAQANISKSCISPYKGSEIPNFRELNLDPERVYMLYRHPDELKKAAQTFNNVPLLSEHVPVDVKDYRPDLVIGATGSDAVFQEPYLKNSLVIWANDAVNGIESDRQKEISCAYYYTPDMTPGEVDGQPYDGVMRDIVANHVAVVVEGRAGPDVVVGDSKPEFNDMPRAHKGRKEGTREAIIAYVLPKMAADATLDDINLLLDKLDETDPTGMDDDMPPVDGMDDGDVTSRVKALLDGKISPEELAAVLAACGGAVAADDDMPDAGEPPIAAADEDGDDDEDDKPIDKAAMDAAIKATEAATIKRMNGIRDAERAVKPYIGETAMSFDSAAGVYRHALKVLGVDSADTIHASALPTILAMQSKPAAVREPIAVDAKPGQSFADRHPNAARVRY